MVDEQPPVEKVQAFDVSRKRKRREPDMNAAFFERKEHKHDECDHSRLGFTYDVRTREVHCRCGVKVEAFDALVFYARAEQRLQDTRASIDAYEQKKVEEKEKRAKAFIKEVHGWSSHSDCRTYRLECGHTVKQFPGRGFKRIWRTATCPECFRLSKLKTEGVGVISDPPPKTQFTETKW